MIEHIPFLPNSEGNTDILGRSLNELSHLSGVLSFLVRETNQYKLQLDFLLLIHLVLQTAFDPDERLATEAQLANRFRNRFKRHITDDFVCQILFQMRSAGWVDKTKQDGIRISNSGIRMGSLLLDMVQRNYIYHEKDELQKEIFIAELSSLNLETNRKLRMESMPNFLQLLNSVHRMTELVQRNIPSYIHKENALEEIIKLKELLLESVKKIEDYTKDETITEKLDDFRLRYHYIEGIIQKAILVGQEGLGEVAKAIGIATSQIWTARISREKFVNSLHENIKSAIQHEYYEESEIQSTYEIMIQMETDDRKPVAFLPVKIFGAISPHDIWTAIEYGERGDYGFDFTPNKRTDILHTEIETTEPEYVDMKELAEIEGQSNQNPSGDNSYLEMFEEVLDVGIKNAGLEETIKDWINLLDHPDRLKAITFMDLISYLSTLMPSHIDLGKIGTSKTRQFGKWSFVTVEGASNLISGDELIRFPHLRELEADNILEQLRGLIRSEDSGTTVK
ncbi:MAG: hypothetical protein ACYDEJ_06655 [Desulfitobacteriaceae bacterium]